MMPQLSGLSPASGLWFSLLMNNTWGFPCRILADLCVHSILEPSNRGEKFCPSCHEGGFYTSLLWLENLSVEAAGQFQHRVVCCIFWSRSLLCECVYLLTYPLPTGICRSLSPSGAFSLSATFCMAELWPHISISGQYFPPAPQSQESEWGLVLQG